MLQRLTGATPVYCWFAQQSTFSEILSTGWPPSKVRTSPTIKVRDYARWTRASWRHPHFAIDHWEKTSHPCKSRSQEHFQLILLCSRMTSARLPIVDSPYAMHWCIVAIVWCSFQIIYPLKQTLLDLMSAMNSSRLERTIFPLPLQHTTHAPPELGLFPIPPKSVEYNFGNGSMQRNIRSHTLDAPDVHDCQSALPSSNGIITRSSSTRGVLVNGVLWGCCNNTHRITTRCPTCLEGGNVDESVLCAVIPVLILVPSIMMHRCQNCAKGPGRVSYWCFS